MFASARTLISDAGVGAELLDRLDLQFLAAPSARAPRSTRLRYPTLRRQVSHLRVVAAEVASAQLADETFVVRDPGDAAFLDALTKVGYWPVGVSFVPDTDDLSDLTGQIKDAHLQLVQGDAWTALAVADRAIYATESDIFDMPYDSLMLLGLFFSVADRPLDAAAVYERIRVSEPAEAIDLVSARLSLELRGTPYAFRSTAKACALAETLESGLEASAGEIDERTLAAGANALALFHFAYGDLSRSIEICDQLLDCAGPNGDPHVTAIATANRGRALLATGDADMVERGLADLRVATRIEPDFADHQVALANELTERGRVGEALLVALDAHIRFPHDRSVIAALAFAKMGSGDMVSARSLYLESHDEERPERLIYAARCALALNDYVDAAALARSALPLCRRADDRCQGELILLEARSFMEFDSSGAAVTEWVISELRRLAQRFPGDAVVAENLRALESEQAGQ